jgi:hypothetical protein
MYNSPYAFIEFVRCRTTKLPEKIARICVTDISQASPLKLSRLNEVDGTAIKTMSQHPQIHRMIDF